MNYKFHPLAESEHLEIIAYYESKRVGLGATYLNEFKEAMTGICEFPSRFLVKRKPDIRRGIIKNFPFAILFREVAGIIQILAVAHNKRRPLYWLARL